MQEDHQFSLLSGFLIVATAVLWGATDAGMKYFSPPSNSKNANLLSYFKSLLTTPAYLVCLLLNQAGSVLYYYCLATAPLSIVSPVVNTGKVLVNVVAGQLLGETPLSAGKIIGLLILLSGIILQLTA